MAKLELVLGGARSGKSSFAEQRAVSLAKAKSKTKNNNHSKKLVYVATAQALDKEMRDRIAHHQQRREAGEGNSQAIWKTIESPLALTQSLKKQANDDVVILVDCLTLWLSNQLCCNESEQTQSCHKSWQQAKRDFIELLASWRHVKADLILVSNEVGHGIVPLGELSRTFVDESGWLHQDIAVLADKVDFIMAGLPLNLKSQNLKNQYLKSQ